MATRVRPFGAEDLGRALELWERAGGDERETRSLTLDQAVDLMRSDAAVVLVAEADDRLVGMAIGYVAGVLGGIQQLTVAPEVDELSVAERLLEGLESALAQRGVRRVGALSSDAGAAAFERRGYEAPAATRYLVRRLAPDGAEGAALAASGGRLLDPRLWDDLKGVDEAKEIIERRVILPLAEPALAARHAVARPKAIVLFGPPGTGKTTFAKGIASRLAWPFVEIEIAQLAGEGAEREAKMLADALSRTRELPSAVVFLDEVEDLASIRHDKRKVDAAVTNEFLKQIPRMREEPEHLLVCATNWVGNLDPAFLRPGRFDGVLPVGPPDAAAREAIWRRYVGEITDEPIDLAALVAASGLFTPADIEFAARKAAQRAFEREHFGGGGTRAGTDDFLSAIADTRPTLTREIVAQFEEDTRAFARY